MSVTIVKRKDKTNKPWVVTQFSGDKRRRIGFPTETEAIAWRDALELEEGARKTWVSPGALPCEEVFRGWLTTYRHTLAESTEQTAERLIDDHLAPWFGVRDLRLIHETHVIEFAGETMEKGASRKLTENAVSILPRIWRNSPNNRDY